MREENKMKNRKKIVAVVLAAVLCAGALATLIVLLCTGAFGGKDKDQNTLKPVAGVYLAEDFSSDYRIVIPADADKVEKIAGEELADFLYRATGAVFSVVSDAGLSYDENKKYISVGDTAILRGSGVTPDADLLEENGCRIVTKGNQIIAAGATSNGTLRSVYVLLDRLVGFEAYTTDIVRVENRPSLPLYELDITYLPGVDIANYSTGDAGGMVTDEQILGYMRMGLIPAVWMANDLNGLRWGGGMNSHTMFKLVPESLYADHPEWFVAENGTVMQVNLFCKDEAFWETVTGNLFRIIRENPDATWFMIGNMDNRADIGAGEGWAEAKAKYRNSGIYVQFLNRVADAVKEEFPDRPIKIFGLAYFSVEAPPVVEAESGYAPIDESVIPRDNVVIQHAPHDACHGHAIDDENCPYNETYRKYYEGWAEISPHMSLWDYGCNFSEYFMYFNTFGAFQGNMRFYSGYGNMSYMFYEANHNKKGPFEELKRYLFAKLAENPDADYDALVEDFMINVFGPASAEVQKFYEDLRNHFTWMGTTAGNYCFRNFNTYGQNWSNKRFWPYERLQSFADTLSAAQRKVDESTLSATEKKDATDRITNLAMYIRYWQLRWYESYYTQAQFDEMWAQFVADCEYFGVTNTNIFDPTITLTPRS